MLSDIPPPSHLKTIPNQSEVAEPGRARSDTVWLSVGHSQAFGRACSGIVGVWHNWESGSVRHGQAQSGSVADHATGFPITFLDLLLHMVEVF